jgi:hypothetical protein
MITPRLQYLIERYGESLVNRLSQETILAHESSANSYKEIPSISRESVLKFSLSDPSRNKSATQWLITTYLNDGFRFEDLLGDNISKVHNTLVQFGLYRGKLPVSARILNQYKTLADVYASIEQFIPRENEDLTLSGKALKRSEREKAHAETEFLHQDDKGLTLVSPKTQFASCWWGKGTQWCTASDNNNMFNHYHKKAPLLIIIMPNGDKLQLHIGEDEFQFMDAQDRDIEYHYIEEHWPILEPIILFAVRQNGRALQYVPDEFLYREIYLETIRLNGQLLCYVPHKLRDREIGLEAVKQDGKALYYVPEELRDSPLCMEAFRQNSEALHYIPEQFISRKLYLEAVRQNGLSLECIPVHFRDKELYWSAVRQTGEALAYVPEELRDREICLEAVKQNGDALIYVPEELRDKEICLEAVRQNRVALYFVPKELINLQLHIECIRQYGKNY